METGTARITAERDEPGLAESTLELTADSVGSGVHGLLRAVLVDAMQCLLGGHRGGRVNGQEWRRTRRWLLDCDDTWPFSFRAICRELEIDASLLRRRLLASMVSHSNVLPIRRAVRSRRSAGRP